MVEFRIWSEVPKAKQERIVIDWTDSVDDRLAKLNRLDGEIVVVEENDDPYFLAKTIKEDAMMSILGNYNFKSGDVIIFDKKLSVVAEYGEWETYCSRMKDKFDAVTRYIDNVDYEYED